MKVSIPTPCHENWQDMTPTEKGAFCKACAVDVIDFSTKSATEIKLILLEKSGKNLCGRFEKSQLETLSYDYTQWENQQTRTFQSKFLLACVLVFGMALFSGCESLTAQNVNNSYFELNTITTVSDSTAQDSTTIQPVEEPIYFLGDISTSIEEFGDSTALDSTKTAQASDTLKPVVKDKPIYEQHPELIMGKFVMPPNYQLHLEESTPVPNSCTNPNFDATLSSNVTSEFTTLTLKPTQENSFTVSIYTVEKQLLETVFSGVLQAKTYTYSIDLSAYANGTYLIYITTAEGSSILKIDKMN